MPHVAVTMQPGRSEEIKTNLAKKIQALVCEEMNLDESVVSVSIEDVAKEDWLDNVRQFPEEAMIIKPGYDY